MLSDGHTTGTREEHLDIVRSKTAYLFAGCAKIGAMLGSTTEDQQDALWDYGLSIGMAFQIVDDLLDFTGEELALGKPVGGDLREGKMTLPVIHMRERGGPAAAALLLKVMEAREVTLDDWRDIQQMLGRCRSIEYARRVAADYVERAKKALCVFPPSEAKDALLFLPEYVISRDR